MSINLTIQGTYRNNKKMKKELIKHLEKNTK